MGPSSWNTTRSKLAWRPARKSTSAGEPSGWGSTPRGWGGRAGGAAGPHLGRRGWAERLVFDGPRLGGEAGLGVGQPGGGIEDGGDEQGRGGGGEEPDHESGNAHGDLLGWQ